MSSGITKRKLHGDSSALGRPFHADVLEWSTPARWQVLMFGGSGVTREKYQARASTCLDGLDAPLEEACRQEPVRLVYVTAPYDLPYARMREGDEVAERWLRHVEEELLGGLTPLPTYLASYSGGAALAFNGVVGLPEVFAAGALAADGLRADMDVGGLRARPLFVFNDDDAVLARNRAVAARLGRLVVLPSGGGHALAQQRAGFRTLLEDGARLLGPDDVTAPHRG